MISAVVGIIYVGCSPRV